MAMAMAMANSSALLFSFTLCLLLSALIIPSPSSAMGQQKLMQWFPRRSQSQGTLAECMEGDEFGMESEISRRILAAGKTISYGSMQRDKIPCSRRGASYYNCKPGAQANPYNRGCSAITRCRSG